MSFDTTQWTVVLAAGGDDSAARAALASLCQSYWYPLYAYIRHRGVPVEDAQDLTQGFLTSLLDRRDFDGLRRDHGRFRAFLLASLKHYLANDAARRRTLKRGHGVLIDGFPLAFDGAEGRYHVDPADPITPEALYERRWALMVIDRVLARLRDEWQADGRVEEFEALKMCLLGNAPAGGYAGVAQRLGHSEGAVKVAVHRLRRRFQTELTRDIAGTVSDPGEIDDEIRYLIRALAL